MRSIIVLVTVFLITSVNICRAEVGEDLKKRARDYMVRNNIRMDEESEIPEFELKYGWTLVDKISYQDGSLLVMRVMELTYGGSEADEAAGLEVLALKEGEIMPFEELVELPDKVTIKMQPAPSSYYYTFKDSDNIKKAFKIHLSGRANILSSLFTGWASKIGKAHDDPTQGRSWRLVKAELDLKGNFRDEVHDIQARDLDNDFEAYYNGGHQVDLEIDGTIYKTLEVGPWNSMEFSLI